jgi:membrane dipeptidase
VALANCGWRKCCATLLVLVASCSAGIAQPSLVVDSHVDLAPAYLEGRADPGVWGRQQFDIPKLRAGGVTVPFLIVYIAQGPRTAEGYEHARTVAEHFFNVIYAMGTRNRRQLTIATSSDEVRRVVEEGRIAAVIGIENGYAIGKDIHVLRRYYDLGARYITLVHNGNNDIGDSARPDTVAGESLEEHGGLTEFGEAVIREMNRLGIMVDISHASRLTMLGAINASKAPVIASHSSVRALVDVGRNLDDDVLRALGNNGGVIQVTAVDEFLKRSAPERETAIAAVLKRFGVNSDLGERDLPEVAYREYLEAIARVHQLWGEASVVDLVNHIDYAVRLIGIDHVGICSDFDGGGGISGWRDASETPNVTAELVRRGYSSDAVRKLWGENLLRVLRQVEKTAAIMRNQE